MSGNIKINLESIVGHELSVEEFKEALEMATDDIKFNRIGFKKKTYNKDLLLVVAQCLDAGKNLFHL